mgnify:CR=1 FL=1
MSAKAFLPDARHFGLWNFVERVTRKQLQQVLLAEQPQGGMWKWGHIAVGIYTLQYVTRKKL